MKFILYVILCSFCILMNWSDISAQTNIVRVEYFIDQDPGYGLATNVSITPAVDISNLAIPINPNLLSTGIHTMVVRAKDAAGYWSLQQSTIFYKPYVLGSTAMPNLTKLEYFVDNDPGVGLATNIVVTPSTSFSNLVLPINPTTLSVGIHVVVLRAKDANGNWSLQNSTVFYKPYSVTNLTAVNLTKLEYFIDHDPGIGLASNVSFTPTTNVSSLVIPLNPASLSIGIHTICLRARDANGNWSLQNLTIFYKPYSLSNSTLPNLTKLEYFIDHDPGIGLATDVSITPGSSLSNLIIPLNPASLSVGIHSIVLRAKDANGNWSLQNSTLLYKPYTVAPDASLSNIVKIEYYVDYDPGYGAGKDVPFSPSTNVADLVIPIDTYPLTVCTHQLFFRAKDANGRWSLINEKPVIIDMTIYAKLMLQGYYAGNGSMKNVLTNEGVQSGPCSEVDSVTVGLHYTSSPYALAFSYKGVLRTDGIMPCKFPNAVNGNSYYMSVQHRHAVETWSAVPILMSQSANYDFTTSSSKAYGDNMVEVDDNVWAIYSGDINHDENIDLLDAVLLETDINDFQFGYYATDINGDGNVDLLDAPIVENNINGFIFSIHP